LLPTATDASVARGLGPLETDQYRLSATTPLRRLTMNFTMVSPAQGYGELVAGLAAERPVLRKAQVMGVAGLSSADQAGLL
jgi:hypothetical protein